MTSESRLNTGLNRMIAERAACERLLNAYLRETGVPDPRLSSRDFPLDDWPCAFRQELSSAGQPMWLALSATGTRLLGTVKYFSPVGHHQFGDSLYVRLKGETAYRPLENAMELATLLMTELAFQEVDPAVGAVRRERLLQQIANSIEKTALYVDRHQWQRRAELNGRADFIAAEQMLIFGHPFHPTPKSSEGFSAEDLERFSPELGAAFPLHYFAVPRALVREDFLPKVVGTVSRAVRLQAQQRLGTARCDWRLLPCHPWQADYLCQLPEVQTLLDENRLVSLGPLGPSVFPTSSVRTVWEPGHGCFLKLSLDVRITNFIRTNPLDQLQRSLDASRVMAVIQPEIPWREFSVLLETGYRTLVSPEWSPEVSRRLAASFAVLFREVPDPTEVAAPRVLAALLESRLQGKEPLIVRALRQAAGLRGVTRSLVREWLRRYLEISLLPILWLFVHRGVSLEAHVQNSLVSFDAGWPARFSVRDLEGASLSRERAAASGRFGGLIDESSPALYTDAEAWNRLKYYVFVNHLGYLLFTLAFYTGCDELSLWREVRHFLQERAALFRNRAGDEYVDELLDGTELPAKANLISRFQERGETPLYVSIPNPLRACEV